MTSNINVVNLTEIISPDIILNKYPADEELTNQIISWREQVANIINGSDKRLLTIIGPCSIHDPIAAIDYAKSLKKIALKFKNELFIVMRVYFEKPRTTVGWKGLINDPYLNETFKINEGLDFARQILLEINKIGLPVGCEFLDVFTPQYLADLVTWGAIGARTTESQAHRQLASGLSMPIGFKNGTGGSICIAAQAITSAKSPHVFLGINEQGTAAIVKTKGNQNCHIILRGGKNGPNYSSEHINETGQILINNNQPPQIMIDCSHGNSQKNHKNQIIVTKSIAEQISNNDVRIIGTMIESNINEGKQNITGSMKYGVSITDACINLKDSEIVLNILADAIQIRFVNTQNKKIKLS
jgi:3-deoxy-7-phosphoheptulonate synthase